MGVTNPPKIKMEFERDKRTKFFLITESLTDKEFRHLFRVLMHQRLKLKYLNNLISKIDPYLCADLLNDTVFCTERIEILQGKEIKNNEEVINENPECEGSEGDDWI